MASKSASIYGRSGGWAPFSQGIHASMTDYIGFPMAYARPSDSHSNLQITLEHHDPTNYKLHNEAASKRSSAGCDTQHSPQTVPNVVSSAAMYSSPTTFTASNAHMDAYGPTTISPLAIRFDVDHASPSSDSKFSFDSQMQYVDSSNFTTFTDDTDLLSLECRRDSLQSNFEAHSPTMSQSQVGRRRGSKYAEPGSVRAIYLEKNRKAANKCRSKQKRQQEVLVETARSVTRRNKKLSAEVAFLKNEMQDLMQLVSHHTECPGTRLRQYLQREADRLAIGGQRNGLPSPSPLSSSSYSGTCLMNKASSPDEE
jgi:cyclic AMP-dependent transcription factor ATF-2